MIPIIQREPLSSRTLSTLKGYQSEIDEKKTYADQIVEANRLWNSRKRNVCFREIKSALTDMCSGAKRCCYCEDSLADEIEHIWPKNFYPKKTFLWEYYLYVCGPCNGPKGNQFAIFESTDTTYIVLNHSEEGHVNRPPLGRPVFINPREENPLDFLWLDVMGKTFVFTPLEEDNSLISYHKASYTIRVLRLNTRSALVAARKNAYSNYRARLREYVSQKNQGHPTEELQNFIRGIKTEHHPTVWYEMKRQHAHIPELAELFQIAPEALDW